MSHLARRDLRLDLRILADMPLHDLEPLASYGLTAADDRSSASGRCPMEVALEVIGTRSAMTLLREAFYGARRFDDLVARAGLSSMTGSARLKQFVSAGLMYKRPYQSTYGTRCEYVLTDLGYECFPVVQALMHFGAVVDRTAAAAPADCLLAEC